LEPATVRANEELDAVAAFECDHDVAPRDDPVAALRAILRVWSRSHQAWDPADLSDAVQAEDGYFDECRDPRLSVELLRDALSRRIGERFQNLFRMQAVVGGEGKAFQTWFVRHADIDVFFSYVEGFMVGGRGEFLR
jgi:hypothetical protein